MSKNLTESIRSLAKLTEVQEQRILELAEAKSYAKGDKLVEMGEVCDHFWFIEAGSVYQYYLDQNLDQVVTGMFPFGYWALDHASFTGRKPTECFLEAFEDTSTWMISIHAVHQLIRESQAYLQLGKILEQVQIKPYRQDQEVDDRYIQLMNSNPLILQTFSLRLIASYLGVTPETLSRIRKRISNRT